MSKRNQKHSKDYQTDRPNDTQDANLEPEGMTAGFGWNPAVGLVGHFGQVLKHQIETVRSELISGYSWDSFFDLSALGVNINPRAGARGVYLPVGPQWEGAHGVSC